ncbi:MAG: isoprenoid biosynthesis glyoxalase ElbB [Proteobacteria bacterium]|nr:isoprenoid biosynthesis glyoxalase ElbB [Pseudomonadota bacterium]
MAHKVGVLLSGCGVYDGAEIHESVITLLALDRAGAQVVCMAPNVPQAHVLNHMTGEEMGETRNVLVESARIARGDIKDLADVRADDIDALIIPGGFGAAKNLSDFAFQGPAGAPNPEVKRLIDEMMEQGKPIGALCIAPATLTMSAGHKSPLVTIGTDEATAGAIGAMGGRHQNCPVEGFVVDEKNRLVTTPAYMLGPGIKDVAAGIEKTVAQVLSMI